MEEFEGEGKRRKKFFFSKSVSQVMEVKSHSIYYVRAWTISFCEYIVLDRDNNGADGEKMVVMMVMMVG